MQTTRSEGERSEFARLQSHGAMYRVGVSPVLHERRGRNSAREKGVMARSCWGRWNAGLCVSMCRWGRISLADSSRTQWLQPKRRHPVQVRCISATWYLVAALAFPIKLSLSVACSRKSIPPGSADGRFVGLDFISSSGTWNVPS